MASNMSHPIKDKTIFFLQSKNHKSDQVCFSFPQSQE